jgi:hypothetical protein
MRMLHPDFENSNTKISLSDIKCMFEFNISGYKTSTRIHLKHFCVLQKYLLKHHALFLALLYFWWRIMSLIAWNQVMGKTEYKSLADDFISCHTTVKHNSITWTFQLQLWLWNISSGKTAITIICSQTVKSNAHWELMIILLVSRKKSLSTLQKVLRSDKFTFQIILINIPFYLWHKTRVNLTFQYEICSLGQQNLHSFGTGRFQCSGMWCVVTEQMVPDGLQDCATFTFECLLGLLDSWRWRHQNPSKCYKLTQQHVTFQKTRILNCAATRTWNLALYKLDRLGSGIMDE